MIKANELRIGNWINLSWNEKIELFGKVLSIGSLDQEFEQIYCECSESFEWAFRDNYRGIPLSGELLEKCGFKYGTTEGISSFEDDGNDPEGTTHYWDKPIIATDLVDSHNVSIVKWGEQEYFTFQLERGFYRQKIKHLHQLQNLYFALTNEELEIKL